MNEEALSGQTTNNCDPDTAEIETGIPDEEGWALVTLGEKTMTLKQGLMWCF